MDPLVCLFGWVLGGLLDLVAVPEFHTNRAVFPGFRRLPLGSCGFASRFGIGAASLPSLGVVRFPWGLGDCGRNCFLRLDMWSPDAIRIKRFVGAASPLFGFLIRFEEICVAVSARTDRIMPQEFIFGGNSLVMFNGAS